MKHYILMSDIIGSRNAPAHFVIKDFKRCTAFINQKYCQDVLSPLTITLGDEFQGVISNLESSINIIIDLEEFIIANNLSLKLRYVLVYGDIETEINNKIAFGMLGKGLTDARTILNNSKGLENRFHINVSREARNIIFNHAFNIFQNVVDRWRIEKDHKVISSFISNPDYKVVARELNKNRSLMWKREKTLNISSYLSVKEIIKTTTQI